MLCIFHEWFNFENYPKFELGQWCTYVHAKSLQLCLTICNPENCSPPGSSVHGILQTRVMEWVAMPSSRGSSWCRNQTRVSCLLHWQAGSLPLVFFLKPWFIMFLSSLVPTWLIYSYQQRRHWTRTWDVYTVAIASQRTGLES